MPAQRSRQVRSSDLIVATASLMLLLMLLAPSIAQSTSDSRKNACLNKMKQLSIGLANHEDARAYLPGASTAAITAKPGNAASTDDQSGYSWLAMTLPYMELSSLYNQMRDRSEKLTKSPFDDAVRIGGAGNSVASEKVNEFVCPAFGGKPSVDVDRSDYKANPAAGGAPAITNYFASSSTHLIPRDGGWFLSDNADVAIQGNGAIPLFSAKILENSWTKVRGVTYAALSRDGTSNTITFCEGREQAYAAWIDGQAAWTVAAWPSNNDLPELFEDPTMPDSPPILGWKAADENMVCITKQRYGASPAEAGVYLQENRWSGSKDRTFGRSGNHPGAVGHAFGDAHCEMIDVGVDRNVYLHLTTRVGREVIPDDLKSFLMIFGTTVAVAECCSEAAPRVAFERARATSRWSGVATGSAVGP